ncbi:hypothetical protein [Leptospira sp. GIMC2001]|uniref:hypothetical protein n=1 Tax=Leptospira sp. GIMC2001 TaxID=1513297 RepID=UPI00234A5025|nr:hypothetical protein [Leptospira sp. GIMC2001]WCL47569.1 hypothetical protein O4O04_00970 [Leptospira sp. GIMC2001]
MIFVGLLAFDSGVLNGFGLRGPYTHETINTEAFKLFSKRTGFEIRVDCAEMINQANYQADVFHPEKPEYHCDSSDFYRCSVLLDDLKTKSARQPVLTTGLTSIGLASHIVQDFYAHSNWVEITRNSYILAPIEDLKEFFALIPNLQSGAVPLAVAPPEESVNCYLRPEDDWGLAIFGATHGCMEKDSNYSLRGGRIAESPFGFGRTYHEIAGELAIEHTTKLFQYFYDTRNPHLMSCLAPSYRTIGCNQFVYGRLRANF